MRLRWIAYLLAGLAPVAAAAQMSVTTFGATDAQRCFERATSETSVDVSSCDTAIDSRAMNRRDRIATYVNRGVIYNRAGKVGLAYKDFNAALAEDPGLAEAFLNRGNSYYLLERYREAIADYERALGNNLAEPWVAWYNIGLAYEGLNDPVKARSAFRTSIELRPDFGPALAKLGEASANGAK